MDFPGVGATKRILLRELLVAFGAVWCPGCLRAQAPEALTRHHILPRSHGGPTTLSNLVLVCRACHDDVHRDPPSDATRRIERFVAGRRVVRPFPPSPDPIPAEEGLRLFLVRINTSAVRTINHHRFRGNPPFDPLWPIGRHFSPPQDDGLVRLPAAA